VTDEVPPAPTIDTPEPAADTAPFDDLRVCLALGWQQVVVVAAFAALFIVANNVPLFHSDVWGHVSYGHWILEHRSLPVEDPFAELAEGVRIVDSAWLAQVVLAAVHRWGGPSGLSNLYALVVTGTYVALFVSFSIRARRLDGGPVLPLIVTAFALVVASSRVLVIRPEIFGNLCFALLLVVTAMLERLDPVPPFRSDSADDESPPPARTPWLGLGAIALLFAAWANLHGSYLVGLAFVLCQLVGRVVEAAWRTRSLVGLLTDPGFRRWLVIVEVASVATFLNPYGVDLLIDNVLFASHPNLDTVLEWHPLHAEAVGATWFGLSLVALAFLLRLGRTPLRVADVLVLLLFAYAVTLGIRMVGWWAAVLGFATTPLLAGLVAGCCGKRATDGESDPAHTSPDAPQAYRPMTLAGPSLAHTAAVALIAWMGFAFAPISNSVLGKGETRPPQKLFNDETPLQLTGYLRKHPPAGLVFAPQWWGDWLVLHGPPGFRPFVTTNVVHVLPHQVWLDTQQISAGDPGWERLLVKYDVTTLIVHADRQPRLADRARDSADWKLVHEDDLALVFTRAK
jgi:hypothetical protein